MFAILVFILQEKKDKIHTLLDKVQNNLKINYMTISLLSIFYCCSDLDSKLYTSSP